MNGRLKYYLVLHITILIFGFTGIWGKLISLNMYDKTWYRMLIAVFGLGIYMLFARVSFKATKADLLKFLIVGGIIAGHWITFFGAIDIHTVSLALACLSSAALFTSILEPIVLKRKVDTSELILGVATIIGISIIVGAEFEHIIAIIMAITSAFLAALFGVLNNILGKDHRAEKITFFEMIGGVLCISLFYLISGEQLMPYNLVPTSDWIYLGLLGILATSIAFVAIIWVMKTLTPFTVALSVNLEPIYAIIMGYFLFQEQMSFGFYIGASLIIATIIVNAIIKRNRRVKAKKLAAV